MLLSATTAGKHPKDHFDFFPLTVDVEERMYAAGRIPGSFFRREGRPREDAILTCRLIDRPLRPSFVKGLRNEIQIVVTIMSLNPERPLRRRRDQRRLDVHPARRPAVHRPDRRRPRRADRGPVGRVPDATSELERAVFDMVVAGRVRDRRRRRDHDGRGRGHRRHDRRWSPAARRRRPRRSSPQGLEAAKPFIRALCEAQSSCRRGAPSRPASSRSSWTTRTTCSRPSTGAVDGRARRRR